MECNNALLKINTISEKELAMRNILSITAVLGALVFAGINDGTAFAKGGGGGRGGSSGHASHGSYGRHGDYGRYGRYGRYGYGRYGYYPYYGYYGSYDYPSYEYVAPSYSYPISTCSICDSASEYGSYAGFGGYSYESRGRYKSGFGRGNFGGHGRR